MPNKDWYWERFETNVVQGELDLNQGQTSALSETKVEGRQDYTDKQRAQYETRFIDQLYGTDQRAWEGEDGPAYHDVRKNYQADIRTMGSGRGGKGGNWENPEHVTWGLDLVRDWTGKENLKFGSDAHFKWQTQGKVDWAHYYNDNAYQKAFADMRESGEVGKHHSNLASYLTAKESGSKGVVSLQSKVDFISAARGHSSADDVDTSKELRDTWDNKYVDQFDPETATPYSPTYLEVPDLWGDADITPTLTPKKVGPPAGLPTLGDIQRTQVTVPTGLKNWGAVSSAPQAKFQAGGQAGAEAGGGGGKS